MKNIKRSAAVLIWVLTGLLSVYSCKNMTKAQKGFAVGAGAGGAVGAGVGKAAGNTALGTILGATVGGLAGGIIGKQMDKQAKEIEQIPGAEVKRVGEGINVTFESGVLFGTNQDAVTTEAIPKLRQLADILNKYPETYILVEGHTDSAGDAAYNHKLSKRRATSVANYLEAQSIPSSRIRTTWYGENQPKYPNDHADNMAKNRRVEFAIYANETLVSNAQQQVGSNN